MNERKKFSVRLVFMVMLVLLTMPTVLSAQEAVETVPVSATVSYTWESPMMAITDDYTVMHGIEPEVWTGDFEGTADAIWRVKMYNNPPMSDVWLISEFTGSLFGEYEGTLTVILVGDNPSQSEPWQSQWYGEWSVVDGTGDFANVHGSGIWWGPGNGANVDPEHETQDFAMMGEIVFMTPTS